MQARVFSCGDCGQSWTTEALGNFRRCPKCRDATEAAHHQKTCRRCQVAFVDTSPKNGQLYCSRECGRRGKLERSGLVPEKGFLADRVQACEWLNCAKIFTPTRGPQRFCSDACRSLFGATQNRTKNCSVCACALLDESRKNTKRYHNRDFSSAWDLAELKTVVSLSGTADCLGTNNGLVDHGGFNCALPHPA